MFVGVGDAPQFCKSLIQIRSSPDTFRTYMFVFKIALEVAAKK